MDIEFNSQCGDGGSSSCTELHCCKYHVWNCLVCCPHRLLFVAHPVCVYDGVSYNVSRFSAADGCNDWYV